MHPRQPPCPRLWLMTDERMGDGLWRALEHLPRGSGVIFRHYATASPDRRALFERVRTVTKRRGLRLILAGSPGEAAAWRADGAHGRQQGSARRHLLRTAPVHDVREAAAARRLGADILFVSPVFATRSHPGARVLEAVRFGRLVRSIGRDRPVVALGGMDARRFRRLRPLGAHGWAGIDAWLRPGAQPVRT